MYKTSLFRHLVVRPDLKEGRVAVGSGVFDPVQVVKELGDHSVLVLSGAERGMGGYCHQLVGLLSSRLPHHWAAYVPTTSEFCAPSE